MEKLYAVLITNNYEQDIEGSWIPRGSTHLQGIFDDKSLTLEAISKMTDELIDYLKKCGDIIIEIKTEHDGWVRRILVDHSDTFSFIRDDRYKVYSLEYEANRLDRIEL